MLSELNRATGTVHADPPSDRDHGRVRGAPLTPREQLRRMLKGDLSAIVLKALEAGPGPALRIGSPIRHRCLQFSGRPPGSGAPADGSLPSRKFIRRRWLPVAAAAVFVLGLSGATFVAFRQARIAQARYSDLRSLTTTLLFELKDAINDVPGSTPAQKILVTRVVRSLDTLARAVRRTIQSSSWISRKVIGNWASCRAARMGRTWAIPRRFSESGQGSIAGAAATRCRSERSGVAACRRAHRTDHR